MLRKILLAGALAASTALTAAPASAAGQFSISIGNGYPGYGHNGYANYGIQLTVTAIQIMPTDIRLTTMAIRPTTTDIRLTPTTTITQPIITATVTRDTRKIVVTITTIGAMIAMKRTKTSDV